MQLHRALCTLFATAVICLGATAIGSIGLSGTAAAGPRGGCEALIAAAKKGYRGSRSALADCYAKRQGRIFDKSKKTYLKDYRQRHHPGQAIERYYRRQESRELIEDALGSLLNNSRRGRGGHGH